VLCACGKGGLSHDTAPADGSTTATIDGGGHSDDAADAGWAYMPTTSVAALTANNTSASSSWTGMVTLSGQPINGYWDEPPGNVSKVPIGELLPGSSVPIWVETQNWWGTPGHIDNGENSDSSAQIAAQVADHLSRGFAGQVVDWYGQGTVADGALPFIQSNAEASGGRYQFAIMIDQGYFENGCGETVACLNSAIAYFVSNYTGSPAYLKDSAGHPLVFFFVNQYYPTAYAILTSSGIDYQNTKFVMYEPNGFPGDAPPQTDGEYAWVNPADGHTGDCGFVDLQGFFSNAANNPGSVAWSAAWKGFDDTLASWSMDRVIDQQCGKVWLETFHHTGSFAGSSSYLGNVDYLQSGKHLDAVMVDTWDDYEEGTEIETGIDNCLASVSVTLTGTTLSWTPMWGADPMDSSVTGDESTLYRYGVYLAKQGGTDLMWIADVACSGGTCGHALDLSQYGITGGPYVFYVQAVGQPSIRNTLGGPTSATYAP
jgi:hypothetical protein